MARSHIVNLANFQQFAAINVLSDPGNIGGPKVVPSVAEIALHWTLPGGKIAANVMHGRYTGTFAGTPAQAVAILTALTTGGPATALFARIATTVIASAVTIRDIASPNQALISSVGGTLAGTGTGAAVPNEVALVVTKRTALTGRANRGRIYIPGWTVTQVGTDNAALPGTVTDLQAWANTVQNAFNASGYQLVIAQPARVSYTGSTGTVHPARPAGSVTVQSLVVRDNHFDSQRRRGLK